MSSTYSLSPASLEDVTGLMRWFPSKETTALWGGPNFHYPFDLTSFLADCRYEEIPGYCLKDSAQRIRGFGQYYERYGRIHFARLVVAPDSRGQGLGQELLGRLIQIASDDLPLKQCSLFVYRHNLIALACYEKAGFRKTQYPEGAPLADVCYYMTRDV